MNDPTYLEFLKWILNGLAMILLSIGAWWGRALAGEIKELKKEQNDTKVFMAKMETSLSGRDQLQDERWKNLDRTIGTLHDNVQALVHAQIKPQKE